MSYRDLLDAIKQNQIKLDEKRLQKVYDFAAAITLASWGQQEPVLEAVLLHEVAEDTDHTLAEINSLFGEEIAFLVDGVTKISRVKLRGSSNAVFVENLRKMFVAMARDIRVILIRLADRFHNMQTLEAVPISKQKRIARETLEVYAPLAERLGMGQLKGDLEDLAFPYVYPTEYAWLMQIAKPHFSRAAKITSQATNLIKNKLDQHQLDLEVSGRPKRKYSLFRKLNRPEIDGDLGKIHDLVALRIITESKMDCYAALGLVHDLW